MYGQTTDFNQNKLKQSHSFFREREERREEERIDGCVRRRLRKEEGRGRCAQIVTQEARLMVGWRFSLTLNSVPYQSFLLIDSH